MPWFKGLVEGAQQGWRVVYRAEDRQELGCLGPLLLRVRNCNVEVDRGRDRERERDERLERGHLAGLVAVMME
eukprot:498431-Rhodomonas_salina.1